MRLVFATDDQEMYHRTRDQLIEHVLTWPCSHSPAPDAFAAGAILDYKHSTDGRLARWTREDVADLLTSWFPRKVTMVEDEWPSITPTFRALIDYLAERDFLDLRAATPADLHDQIDSSTPELLAGMADERRYDIGKFWGTQMVRHGVDIDDDRDVQRFVDAARAGQIDVDHDVLDAIMQRQFGDTGSTTPDHPGLPPVLLATGDELSAAAEASTTLTRLRAFVEWLGAGRPLTSTGRLKIADARELTELLGVDQRFTARARSSEDLPTITLLVHWALAARSVRKVKGRLVPVKSAAPLLRRPAQLWRRVFATLPDQGPLLSAGAYGTSLLAHQLPEIAPTLWMSLYGAGTTPIPVELMHSNADDLLLERYGPYFAGFRGELDATLTRRDMDALLEAAELLGALRIEPITDPAELADVAEFTQRPDPDPRMVALTPLGLWGVHQVLAELGIPVPVVGDLAEEDIEYLLVRLTHAQADVTERELDAWVEHRGPQLAADELARFIERTDDPVHRLLALEALTRTGEVGVETGRAVRSRGGAAGAAATFWLLESGAVELGSVTEQERMLALTDQLVALDASEAMIEFLDQIPRKDLVGLLHQLAAAAHPRLPTVLDTVAGGHPDRKIAKAARKLRFTLTSSTKR